MAGLRLRGKRGGLSLIPSVSTSRSPAMLYVGADLHKKSISLCVVTVENGKQRVLRRQTLACRQTEAIRRFFAGLGPFRLAVEATAAYEWLFQLIDDLAA